MAMMCEGSNLSNGNRNPVALVRIVVTRNNAVQLGITLEPRSPDRTTRPETTPIRLMMTCSIVKVDRLIPRTMTRSPLLERANATTANTKKPPAAVVPVLIQALRRRGWKRLEYLKNSQSCRNGANRRHLNDRETRPVSG